MEAIVAVGVAGNVLQFLDFASKLCSTSLEIYRTANGTPTSNAQTEALLKGFIESMDGVSSDLAQYRTALSVTSKQAFIPGQNELGTIISDCQNLANDLMTRFEKLKASGRPGLWKSFVTGVKCMWKKKELDELQLRLQQHRKELEWRMLVSLRDSVNLQASRQADQFEALQVSIIAKLTETIRNQVVSLPRWPESGAETQQKLRSEEIAARAAHPSRYKQPKKSALRNANSASASELSHNQESFVDEYAQEYAARLAEFEEEQWESLSFPVMYDREDQIDTADLSTFNWIFEEPRNKDRPWSNFLEWLEKSKGLYWINGKAGSGKSTLTKFLSTHQKTKDALQAWSGNTPLIVATFFFWYNGNDLQKSQIGLLRSLLYQALTNHRELVPLVLCEAAGVVPTGLTQFWTLSRLKNAFKKLLEQQEVPLKICLLVDGLDEYAGDTSEIAQLFRSLSDLEHVKLCVSSRPLLAFDRTFRDFPGLVLQNLTFDDIHTYVQNRFNIDERFKEFEIEESGLGFKLASEVVSKASGVFLWVKLVVHSLLEGLGNYDRSVDLERRLSELPEDLDDLYWHILDRVKPAWYLEEGFKLLLLVDAAVVPLYLLQLAFADMIDLNLATKSRFDEMILEKQQTLCHSMAGRIKSRCLGLLEVTDTACTDEKYRRVQFLHKSVNDFMHTPRMESRIQECLAGKEVEVPEVAIMKALLIQLKTMRALLSEEQCHTWVEGSMSREAWFDEVRPVVFEIVRYGRITTSKYPGKGQVYHPLITQVDEVASDLWQSVTFRSPQELAGEVHWSVAPRLPGATVIEARDRSPADTTRSPPEPPSLRNPEALTLETQGTMYSASRQLDGKDEAGWLGALKHRSPDASTMSKFSSRSVLIKKVQFGGLTEPQCFPGGNDELERPQRLWPSDVPSSSSPFHIPAAKTLKASCGFEAFVRAFDLDEYADERFKSVIKFEDFHSHTESDSSQKLVKKSFWHRLKLKSKSPR